MNTEQSEIARLNHTRLAEGLRRPRPGVHHDDELGSLPMEKLVWSFLAGFLVTAIAFAALSAIISTGLEQPIRGWLSDSGGRRCGGSTWSRSSQPAA